MKSPEKLVKLWITGPLESPCMALSYNYGGGHERLVPFAYHKKVDIKSESDGVKGVPINLLYCLAYHE